MTNQLPEYSKDKIIDLGKKIKYCRDCKMRWCLIEHQTKIKVSELKRILCLYLEINKCNL